MNPLYQLLTGNQSPQQNTISAISVKTFQNPIQKVNYILQAMNNPAVFVKEQFPDIPEEIQNDPNKILGYLQQSRGISNEQLQGIMRQFGRR